MPRYVVTVLIYSFLIGIALPAYALNITVAGMGVSEDAAIEDALSKAINTAGAKYISDYKAFSNGKLVDRKTTTLTNGIVEGYTLLERQSADGKVWVLVKAEIDQKLVAHASDVMYKSLDVASLERLFSIEEYQNWLRKAAALLDQLVEKEHPERFFRKAYVAQVSDFDVQVGIDYIDVDISLSIIPDPVFWHTYDQLLSMLMHRTEKNIVIESASMRGMTRLCGKYQGQQHLAQAPPAYYLPQSLIAHLVPPIEIRPVGTLAKTSKKYLYKNALIDGEFFVAMTPPTLFTYDKTDSDTILREKNCASLMILERGIHALKQSAHIFTPFHYVPLVQAGGSFIGEGVSAELIGSNGIMFSYRVKNTQELQSLLQKEVSELLQVFLYTPTLRYVN